jgi:hypothetical protein
MITVLVYIVVISIILASSYTTTMVGRDFYNERKITGKCVSPKIFDIGFRLLPDYSNTILYEITEVLYVIFIGYVMARLYTGGKSETIILLLKRICVLFLIRGILINATILPKNKSCNDQVFNWKNLITGQCYDKVLSGHFATIYIASSIAVSNGIINNTMYILLNIMNALLILLYRGHYISDIAFGFFAGFFVGNIVV